jgi:myo-inositol 2-dehydrogenase/D-chiro-inositol 1-dehydrogenase
MEGEEMEYPTLIDGLKAQIIAEAAVESLQTKQPVEITYWSPEQ